MGIPATTTYLGQGVLWQLHLCKCIPPVRNVIMWSSSWCQLWEKQESYHQDFLIFFLLSAKISSKSCQGKYHSIISNGLKLQHSYSWWINIDPTDSGWKRKQEESHFVQRVTKARISGESLGKAESWLHLGHYVTCWYHSFPLPYHKTVCSSLSAELLCRPLVRSAGWQTWCLISISASTFGSCMALYEPSYVSVTRSAKHSQLLKAGEA